MSKDRRATGREAALRRVVGGVCVVAASAAALAQNPPQGATPRPASPVTAAAPPPRPAPPEAVPLPPERRILVQAMADTETVISSPMVGVIQQIPTVPGTRFARGDALIRYDCTENEARAQIAQAEHGAASENLAAKIRLQSMDAASEIEVTTAAAQASKAEGQLKLAQHQVRQCQVLAPFDGYVVRVMGRPHQTATIGQPMLEIITAGTPRLRVSADSRLFGRIRTGSQLLVRIDETGKTYAAQVTLLNARIDPVNQSFEMEARLHRPAPDLLPGMTGSAAVVEARDGPVPKPASPATGAPR